MRANVALDLVVESMPALKLDDGPLNVVKPDIKIECSTCAIGKASGVDRGHFCPFIERDIKAGEAVYKPGAEADHVWFIREGTVVLSRELSEEGTSRARAVRFAGSFLGLESLIANSYSDSAVAVTDVSVCGATREGVDAWLGPKGTPARTALEMTLRTGASDRPREARTDGSSVGRLARWLQEEGPRGVTLNLPRRVVADLLGMRAETLSRALAELSKRGAIETTRTTLRIIDDQLLAAAVE